MLSLNSPAKVNLFLRILGKRTDGFHEIATLMHTIDLADTLTLSLAKEDAFSCTDPRIGGFNLVTRAVDLFRETTGWDFHLSIHLEKNIPLEAGLGGGSSNAAATLKGINELLGCPVSSEELQQWSGKLGSDVPFFFSSGVAYCTGRGEKIRDLPDYRLSRKIGIYKPEYGLSTPAVYKELNLKECSSRDPEDLLQEFLSGGEPFLNDLETPAFRLMPLLIDVKRKTQGIMSGSGTAFFIAD